jgi:hypothetical protein
VALVLFVVNDQNTPGGSCFGFAHRPYSSEPRAETFAGRRWVVNRGVDRFLKDDD